MDSGCSRDLWTDVLSDGSQRWVSPGLSGAQIVDLQLKLRFRINAPVQLQAVLPLIPGGF